MVAMVSGVRPTPASVDLRSVKGMVYDGISAGAQRVVSSRHAVVHQRREFALPVFIRNVHTALFLAGKIECLIQGLGIKRDRDADLAACTKDFQVNRLPRL